MGPTNRRRITVEVEARIIAVALRHPNHGPRRLAKLLQRDRISVTTSSINSVLRQKDLRFLEKRIEKAKKLAQEEALARSHETAITGKTDHLTEPSESEKPMVVWLKPRKRWQQGLFSPLLWGKWMVQLALVIMAVYTGFYIAQHQRQALRDIREVVARVPGGEDSRLSAKAEIRFSNPSRVVYPDHPISAIAKMEKIDADNVAPQSNNRRMADEGWKLIGTMVAEPAQKSIAVIEYLKTQVQDTVNEGDRAGGLRIKTIMRDRIIVDTGDNEVLIAMNRTLPAVGQESIAQSTIALAQVTAATSNVDYTAGRKHRMNTMRPTGRSHALHLDRQVVEVSLADPDQVLQQAAIEPAESNGHPSGFRISSIEAGSIFADLGLQSTDVIVGVNGASITTPDQAALLVQSIKAGGNVTIQVKGKRRNRIIQLDIS